MTRHAQLFRIRFIGRSGTVHEVAIAARDAVEAIRAAREVNGRKKALRLIDTVGREFFWAAKDRSPVGVSFAIQRQRRVTYPRSPPKGRAGRRIGEANSPTTQG
jgi:hypothetical protein